MVNSEESVSTTASSKPHLDVSRGKKDKHWSTKISIVHVDRLNLRVEQGARVVAESGPLASSVNLSQAKRIRSPERWSSAPRHSQSHRTLRPEQSPVHFWSITLIASFPPRSRIPVSSICTAASRADPQRLWIRTLAISDGLLSKAGSARTHL